MRLPDTSLPNPSPRRTAWPKPAHGPGRVETTQRAGHPSGPLTGAGWIRGTGWGHTPPAVARFLPSPGPTAGGRGFGPVKPDGWPGPSARQYRPARPAPRGVRPARAGTLARRPRQPLPGARGLPRPGVALGRRASPSPPPAPARGRVAPAPLPVVVSVAMGPLPLVAQPLGAGTLPDHYP